MTAPRTAGIRRRAALAAGLLAGPTAAGALLVAGAAPAAADVRQTAPCAIADRAPSAPDVGLPAISARLGVEDLWRYSRGDGQTVAVIDTGVTPNPRLHHLAGVGDFVGGHAADAPGTAGRAERSPGLVDCDAHGTLVAGLIAAAPSPADGFAGIAPGARILSIRQSSAKFTGPPAPGGADDVDDARGSVTGSGTIGSLARAIRLAVDSGADVINISEVACGAGVGALRSDALASAVDRAAAADVVIVAAAGNTTAAEPGTSGAAGPIGSCRQNATARDPLHPGDRGWSTAYTDVAPAHYARRVLTVGSVDPDGSPSDFSLAGPWVSVAAPGTAVTSLANDPAGGLADRVRTERGVSSVEGTSFAAPLVAGLAALIRSRYPDLTADEVVHRITATAIPGAHPWEPTVGYGVIDPIAALTAPPGSLPDRPRTALSTGGIDSTDGIDGDSAPLPPPATAGEPDRAPRIRAIAGTAAGAVLLAALGTVTAVRRRARSRVTRR